MAIVREIDGSVMADPRGLTIYEVRFVPGTGWQGLDPQIREKERQGTQIEESLHPDNFDLSVVLKPGLILNRGYLASNMRTVTDVNMAEAMNNAGGAAILHQFAPICERVGWVRELRDRKVDRHTFPLANSIDEDGTPPVFAAVGYEEMEKDAMKLVEAGVVGIFCDSENGYTPSFRRKVERTVGEIQATDGGDLVFFVVGNVATAWGVEQSLEHADMASIGIGSGVPCETPLHGTHVPQLGAIYKAAQVAEDRGKGVIYDGGAKDPFAHAVAFAFCQLVKAGSYWAATEDSAAQKIRTDDGMDYAVYQGSASTVDRIEREQEYPEKYSGTKKPYRPREGRSGLLRVKGTVAKKVEITDRTVRLNMWYVGAYDLDKMRYTFSAFREYAELQRLSEEALRQLDKGRNFTPLW